MGEIEKFVRVKQKQVIQETSGIPGYIFLSSEMDNLLTYTGTDDIDYATLARMYNDPDVERFVSMKASLSSSMIQGYTHPNKEIERFVWETLRGAEGSFHLTVADAIADCSVYGHHFSEIVWYRDGDKYRIKRFVYVVPEERTVALDTKHDIKSLKHSNGEIPRNKLLYLNFRPNRGLFGKSEISELYPYFLLNRTAVYNLGKTMERFGFPWAIGKSIDTETMLDTLKNMYHIASAAIDSEESIELVEPRNAGEIFDTAIGIALSAFLRKLGIPELMVNVKNHGTYNLGETQFTWFIDENENQTKNKNDVLISAFVKPIIDINFGENAGYGEFVIVKSPNAESMKQYASILQSLMQGNTINDNIRYAVLERMGMLKDAVGTEFEKNFMQSGDSNGKDYDDGGKDSERDSE